MRSTAQKIPRRRFDGPHINDMFNKVTARVMTASGEMQEASLLFRRHGNLRATAREPWRCNAGRRAKMKRWKQASITAKCTVHLA